MPASFQEVVLRFVGIDWRRPNPPSACSTRPARPSALRHPHSAAGFDDLLARLRRLGAPAGLPVAIQRPDGRLVDRLLEAGHPVVPVRAGDEAWREGEVVSGAKSDAGDAKQPAAAPPPAAGAHAVPGRHPGAAGGVRARGELVRQRVAAINQPTATLEAFWPDARVVSPDAEREIALAFLERYPTPASAIHLGEQRTAAFLTRHRYRGQTPAAELVARLRAAPAGLAGGLSHRPPPTPCSPSWACCGH
jgi:hypothetical protein